VYRLREGQKGIFSMICYKKATKKKEWDCGGGRAEINMSEL
jgi:hypothetical protein